MGGGGGVGLTRYIVNPSFNSDQDQDWNWAVTKHTRIEPQGF